jgi:hypothetical protein
MDSFSYIISSFFTPIDIYNIHNKELFNEAELNNKLIDYGFIYSLQEIYKNKLNKAFTKNKFNVLNDCVLYNAFIDDKQKEVLLDKFGKSQRAYHGFQRLARLYKIKKAKICTSESDLCMNPLNELPKNIIIDLYDASSRTIYKFRISDIINIINTGLCYSVDFFADPQPPMNPYTNIEFTKSQLYTIYFKVKESNYIMPHLLHMFFIHNFDIDEFCKYNECYIREVTIKNFVSSGSDSDKYYHIMEMLFKYLKDIKIHRNFPVAKLISTFSGYLYDYLSIEYSLNPTSRHISKLKLKKMLAKFTCLNPHFGKKIYTQRIWTYYQQPRNIPTEIPTNFNFSSDPTNAETTTVRSYYIDNVNTNETNYYVPFYDMTRENSQSPATLLDDPVFAHAEHTQAEDMQAEDTHAEDTHAEDTHVEDTQAEDTQAEDTRNRRDYLHEYLFESNEGTIGNDSEIESSVDDECDSDGDGASDSAE